MPDLVDISDALKKAANKPELAQELFAMLLNELPQRMENIQQAYASQNYDALYEQAHKLYGATAYCGVPALQSCSQQLELHCKSGETDQLAQSVDAVIRVIKKMIEECPAMLNGDWSSHS